MSKLFLFIFYTGWKQQKVSSLPLAQARKVIMSKLFLYFLFILDENSKRYPLCLWSKPQSQHVQTIPIYLSYWMKTAKGILSTSGPSPQSHHVQTIPVSSVHAGWKQQTLSSPAQAHKVNMSKLFLSIFHTGWKQQKVSSLPPALAHEIIMSFLSLLFILDENSIQYPLWLQP